MPTKKLIADFNVTFHGYQNSQYFQGHGIDYTEYTDCATGIGSSDSEALADALEQLACNGWDTATIKTTFAPTIARLKATQRQQEEEIDAIVHEDCDPDENYCDNEKNLYFYVSVDVRRSRKRG